MYVHKARIRLSTNRPIWLGGGKNGPRIPSRKLKWFEFKRMPCVLPTVIGSIVGFIVFCSGALLCYIGYNPEKFFNRVTGFPSNETTPNYTTISPVVTEFSALRGLVYVGPILMGIGFFVLIVAVVLFCEIRDKFVQNIVPKRNVANTRKRYLYDMVIEEFRKNYFRGIEVPLAEKRKKKNKIATEMPTLYKALSISTPALLITPEVQRRWKKHEKLTPRHKRKRCLSESDAWLKTSSMPNIRPKSFKRIQRRLSKHLKFEKTDFQKSGLSKKSNNETVINNVKIIPEICFSNPAFRGTSPEPIELKDITTNFSSEQSENPQTVDLTQVIVHTDAKSEALDTRGITERRHSDVIINSTDIANHTNNDILANDMQNNFKIPDIYCTDSLDQTYLISNRNKGRHKSMDHLDIGRKGPYKTCIGIFRSESCLHKMRKILNHSDEDGDSLTLGEDLLKNFEYSTNEN